MTVEELINELRNYPPEAPVARAMVRVKIGKRTSTLTVITPSAPRTPTTPTR